MYLPMWLKSMANFALVRTWEDLGSAYFSFENFTVEARKLENQYPHALKVKYRGS